LTFSASPSAKPRSEGRPNSPASWPTCTCWLRATAPRPRPGTSCPGQLPQPVPCPGN